MTKQDDKEHPLRFCSPGLQRALMKLDEANQVLKELSDTATSMMAVAAVSQSRGLAKRQLVVELSRATGIELLDREALLNAGFDVAWSAAGLNRTLLMVHRSFPVQTPKGMSLAMADPFDSDAVREVSFLMQCSLRPVFADEQDIVMAIRRTFPDESDLIEAIAESTAGGHVEEVKTASTTESVAADDARAPVVQLVNKMLSEAIRLRASDVHLEPTAEQLLVRFRVDGLMLDHLALPAHTISYVSARLKIMSGMDISVKLRPQDGRFSAKTSEGENVDVRASAVPTAFGEKIVLRLLRNQVGDLSLEKLDLPAAMLASLKNQLAVRERMVLVTGPTGSGKSTTLYAALNYLRQGPSNIVTVEDPVEFRVSGITQIQVDPKAGVSFASGLRSVLRQDPDIILLGEIRDQETATIACQAAQTGHLVLSTLHTNNAPAAIVRLMDLGLEPFVIASSVGAVVAQRLVRVVCPHCAQALPDSEAAALRQKFGIDGSRARRGAKCEECSQTGYRGRKAVYSLLVIDDKLREVIRQGKGEGELSSVGRAAGMLDLFEAGLQLVASGETTLEEVERVIGSGHSRTSGSVDNRRSGEIRVLLVDDEREVRSLMASVLAKEGYQVLQASDVMSALEAVETHSPEVVVCDLRMPGLTGLDFVRKVRSQVAGTQVKILMLTGDDSEKNEIVLLNAGADDFVSKSGSLRLITTRIKRLLQREPG